MKYRVDIAVEQINEDDYENLLDDIKSLVKDYDARCYVGIGEEDDDWDDECLDDSFDDEDY